MLRRWLASLFVVAFFAALPAWFLSTLQGWITIDCGRKSSVAALDCTVREKLAFGSRSATYETLGARVKYRAQHDRRGRSTTYQLVLVTPAGEKEVLSDPTGNEAVMQVVDDLNAVIRQHRPAFHAKVSPDTVFWIAVGVFALFSAAGIFIAWSRFIRPRSPARDESPKAHEPAAGS